jgi:hypothetical protein
LILAPIVGEEVVEDISLRFFDGIQQAEGEYSRRSDYSIFHQDIPENEGSQTWLMSNIDNTQRFEENQAK